MEVERLLEVAIVAGDASHGVFQAVEVGEGHAELGAGDDLERAHSVVRGEGDVICLRHVGDFAHLCDAASEADVGHDVVGEFGLEDFDEVVAGEESLADADWDRHLESDEFERGVAFRGYRLFEPADVGFFVESVPEADGGGGVEVAVGVDEDLVVWSDGFPDCGDDV